MAIIYIDRLDWPPPLVGGKATAAAVVAVGRLRGRLRVFLEPANGGEVAASKLISSFGHGYRPLPGAAATTFEWRASATRLGLCIFVRANHLAERAQGAGIIRQLIEQRAPLARPLGRAQVRRFWPPNECSECGEFFLFSIRREHARWWRRANEQGGQMDSF